MALIVEDGTGLPTANGNVSRAAADAYFKDRGNTTWSGVGGSTKDGAIIEATQFLDASYKWRGSKISREQGVDWPRVGVVDDEGFERASNSVPKEIEQATYELAVLRLSGVLLPAESRGGMIDRVKAGSVEVEFSDRAPPGRTYEFVERLIDELTEGRTSGVTVQLFRA